MALTPKGVRSCSSFVEAFSSLLQIEVNWRRGIVAGLSRNSPKKASCITSLFILGETREGEANEPFVHVHKHRGSAAHCA